MRCKEMGYISLAYHFTPGPKHHLRVRETYLARLRLTSALQVQKTQHLFVH